VKKIGKQNGKLPMLHWKVIFIWSSWKSFSQSL